MKHNLCVIGYGGMGGWHVGYAQNSDVVELKGVYDIKKDRIDCAKANGINTYDSLDAVLADKEIDLVTIATPNDVHEEIAIACMKAGKNVISEKPVTLSVESLKRMIAAAEQYGVKFSVHQNRRWDNDYLAIKGLYENNTLGDIFNVESRVQGSRGIPGDWRRVKKYGGGMLFDWGVHLIDQILMIYEDVALKRLYCEFTNYTNAEVDDGFKLTMYFENGARAYVEVGTYNFIELPRFYIQGEMGTGVIRGWNDKCRIVKYSTWSEENVVPVKTAAGLTKTMAPRDDMTTESFEIDPPESDVHDYYRNFCSAIEGKCEQLITHRQMLRTLSVIEASFKSVEEKSCVDFVDEYKK